MDKYRILINNIKRYKSAVIAYSGGTDSAFLAYAAREALGNNLLLVTASSPIFPSHDTAETKNLAKTLGINHITFQFDALEMPVFTNNPPDRCYHCKKDMLSQIIKIAAEKKYDIVLDGNNADDLNDHRPGRKALNELGVVSPLCEAGYTKSKIRSLSEKFGLPTAHKPASPCLATRFPYGEKITKEKLARVENAEEKIRNLGFTVFRVRSHLDLARLEFIPDEMGKAWAMMDKMTRICKDSGFIYVSIDTEGYMMGAMNE